MRTHGNVEDIDQMIREALGSDDPPVGSSEQSLYEQAMAVMKGRNRWVTWLSIFWGIVFMAVAVWSLVRFVGTDDLIERLNWGALLFFSLLLVFGMKVWYWMEMERHAITREIKRVELQVVQLRAALERRRGDVSTDR